MVIQTPPRLLSRLALFIAILVGVAIPLRAVGVAGEQTALGLALLASLILLADSATIRRRVHDAVLSRTGLAVIAIFAAWVLTIFFSHNPAGSLKIGGRTALFLLAAVVLWAALVEHEETHRLLWKTLVVAAVAFAGLTVLSLVGVPHVLSLMKAQMLVSERPTMSFKAYATSTMCLIPVVILAGRRLNGAWRWWGYAFVPLALGVMILTYNRSALAGFLAMAVAGVLLLALTRRSHAKLLIGSAFALVVAVVSWVTTREAAFSDYLQHLPGAQHGAATYLPDWLLDSHRQNIWKFAFERFLDHPWVGNGIDQLNRLPGAKMHVPGLDNSAALIPSHPHNWALEILAETGLIGFLPVVMVLLFVAVKLAKRYLQNDDEADLALFTLMAGFWASALFNFSIWATWWQLTFFVLFAVVAASRTKA